MGVQSDVKSINATTSGSIISNRVRIKHITYVTGILAGTLALYDNTSASGIILWQTTTPAVATTVQILLPGEGILATTGVYLSISNVSSVTICYG